jgi:hypothetical protein
MKEILWNKIFSKSYRLPDIDFAYNGKTITKESVSAKAQERADELDLAKRTILSFFDDKPVYVKLTAGSKAGTIGSLVATPSLSLANHIRHGRAGPSSPSLTSKVEVTTGWAHNATGSFVVTGYLQTCLKHNALVISNSNDFAISVDGKEVLRWNDDSASVKSARPVLLIGYEGPEVLVKGRPVKNSGNATIKDRYGRDVTKGDLAVIGMGKSGVLVVGKIESISDARTVKLKHIGGGDPISLTGVMDEQVLLLTDDIKAVLMMEKLKSL